MTAGGKLERIEEVQLRKRKNLREKRAIRDANYVRKKKKARAAKLKRAEKVFKFNAPHKFVKRFRMREKFERDGARRMRVPRKYDAPANLHELLLVIRIKGTKNVPELFRDHLRSFGLHNLYQAVLIRKSKKTMEVLKLLGPFVTYGSPPPASLRDLIYRRGSHLKLVE